MPLWKKHTSTDHQPLTPWEKYQQQAADNTKKNEQRHFTWSGKRIRIGDKLPKLQHQRRRLVTKRASILIAAFGVIALVMIYAISPLSHISRVQVRGNSEVSAKQVMVASQVKPGVAIWAVIGHDSATTQSAQRRNPQLKQIATSLIGYNSVRVTAKEIPTAGYLVKKSGYQPVLENGRVLTQTVNQPAGNSPIYAGFKSGRQLKAMIIEYAKLPTAVKHNISELQFSPTKADPARIHLFMNDGNEVYAAITGFGQKMTYYPAIASKLKHRSIVNLEVGAYSYPIKKH